MNTKSLWMFYIYSPRTNPRSQNNYRTVYVQAMSLSQAARLVENTMQGDENVTQITPLPHAELLTS